MGYLEDAIENDASQMEIDWCDTMALQFGAFAPRGNRKDLLVGTARMVITSADSNQRQALLELYRHWIGTLIRKDPVLQESFKKGALPMELPIFHSQKLISRYRETLRRGEVCGELSRVIVREDYRGAGLSTRLVDLALCEAARVGVRRIFLECLALHEGLYEKLGFRRINGTRGTVISVNQTMIGMEFAESPMLACEKTANIA
jgi:N-acetylglutamate synthase-like GNAT family acetyltransferase